LDGLLKGLFERPWVRILAAVLAAVPPFVLHQGLAHTYGYFFPPFLFYWPVIIAISLWLGFRAGLVTTITGGVLVDYWIFQPIGGWLPVVAADGMGLVIYVVLGVFLSAIAARYRMSARRVAALESERALRASEDRFRAVLRESRDIVYRLNLKNGEYDYISPSVFAVLGYTDEEFKRMPAQQIIELLHPDDVVPTAAALRNAERRGQGEFEYRVRAKDGNYRWLSNLVFHECDASGAVVYREGNIRDITAAKAAHGALLRSSALASAGRMSATIAHEINNPLTAVTNLLFLAQSCQELPEPVRDYLARADAELQRIGVITRRTLGFYRQTAEPQQVMIDGLLEACIDLFRRQMEQRGARVVKDCQPGLAVTVFDGELRQVFTNLLSNSLDAIGKGGFIRIRARQSVNRRSGAACIRIAVADDGHGIADEVQAQIFEPFFTTKGNVGTGLGLWVSAQLVEKNGGTIRVRSVKSFRRHGTVFVVELPV
jgi:PAS domain S-box-containing protein